MATDSTTTTEQLPDLMAGGDAHLVAKLADTVERLDSEETPALVLAVDTPAAETFVLLHISGQCAVLPSFQSESLIVCTWLRAVNVPFKTVNHKLALKNAGGRFPMAELGDDELGPTENLLEKLSRRLDRNLDEGLTPHQKILAYAMASTVEHTLGAAHRRWCNENRGHLLRAYDLDLKRALKRSAMPRGVLEFFFRRSASRNEKSRGQLEDAADERLKTVRMISEFLSDRQFCFSDSEVTTLDVVAFGVLAPILAVSGNVAYPLRDQMILNYPNLVVFVERVKQRLYPDWVDLCCGRGSSYEDGKCAVDKKHKLELHNLNSSKERKPQSQSDKVLENNEAAAEQETHI